MVPNFCAAVGVKSFPHEVDRPATSVAYNPPRITGAAVLTNQFVPLATLDKAPIPSVDATTFPPYPARASPVAANPAPTATFIIEVSGSSTAPFTAPFKNAFV
jgi:hypothetical protein